MTTTGFEAHRARLLELVDWIGEVETQTLALKRFVRDYRTLANTSPVNCHINALDMLGLRKDNLLNDRIIMAALETVCAQISGAVACCVLSFNAADNVRK